MKLKISPDLTLPLDFVTWTMADLGIKGSGKSHVAQVAAEELLDHGQQIVAIDPTDAWYGLRSSADGKSAGYPVVIFGGEHGQLPLEDAAGVELADAVMAGGFSCVLCTEGMTAAGEIRVVREFLERLYRKNRKPIHVFVDESDLFAPQQPHDPEDAKSIRTMSNIVRRGRKKGIGCSLITQRPAELNKGVLAMCDMLVVLGMSHNLDIEQVERWVKNKRNPELARELVDSLPILQPGDAWAWHPRKNIHTRFRAREKRTFDSGATPKPGQQRREPRVLSQVDLQKLGQAISDAAARAKENDPKELKARVAKLAADNQTLTKKLELANAKPAKAEPAVREKIVETKVEHKVASAKQLARVESLIKQGNALVARMDDRAANAFDALSEVAGKFSSNVDRLRLELTDLHAGLVEATEAASAPVPEPRILSSGTQKLADRSVHPTTNGASKLPRELERDLHFGSGLVAMPSGVQSLPEEGLNESHRRTLTAIHMLSNLLGAHPDRRQVALVAKYSPTSGTYQQGISDLRKYGMIDYPGPAKVALTTLGNEHVDPTIEVPTTNEAIHRYVQQLVGESQWKIVRELIGTYPEALTRKLLADRLNLSITSGTFQQNISDLHKGGIVEYGGPGTVRAAAMLFVPEPAPVTKSNGVRRPAKPLRLNHANA